MHNRKELWTRRAFLQMGIVAGSLSVFEHAVAAPEDPFSGLTYADPTWKRAGEGLDFCRIEILRGNEPVETAAVLRVNPAKNRIQVFHSFAHEKTVVHSVEEWLQETSAVAVVNGAQYMADPFYMPCALVISDGQIKGPKSNKQVRGMLVAEPKNGSAPRADLLDFEYDSFDYQTTPYTQGVQHWPILLDRNSKIKVNRTEARANRAVVIKDRSNNILFFTTEGNFFTLHGLGQFFNETNHRKDGGLKIHTAMNLDGGHEAAMTIQTPGVVYSTSVAIAQKAGKDKNVFGWTRKMPGVIGVFPEPDRQNSTQRRRVLIFFSSLRVSLCVSVPLWSSFTRSVVSRRFRWRVKARSDQKAWR